MRQNNDRPKHYVEIDKCRLCRSTKLVPVLDLGEQVLSGRFPLPPEPDPMRAPLQLVRCDDWSCGLVQLRHTVDPGQMFVDYWYRSGVSETMRAHLAKIAEEAEAMLVGKPKPDVLDIGCNDGTLLSHVTTSGKKVGIDPSNVPLAYPGIDKVTGLFPSDYLLTKSFDIVFTIACFYDVPEPVHFAQSVKRVLAKEGLWVVEVADMPTMLEKVAFDAIVSEHLVYYSAYQMSRIAREAGLKIVRAEPNDCNGGSVRYYMAHEWAKDRDNVGWKVGVANLWQASASMNDLQFDKFAKAAVKAKDDLGAFVEDCRAAGKRIHLLGASTKSGTILQWAGLTATHIEAASDRDARKAGRVMPGSRIPIVPESVSRRMEPDVYLTVLPFKKEIIARERKAGNKAEIVAILPELKKLA